MFIANKRTKNKDKVKVGMLRLLKSEIQRKEDGKNTLSDLISSLTFNESFIFNASNEASLFRVRAVRTLKFPIGADLSAKDLPDIYFEDNPDIYIDKKL